MDEELRRQVELHSAGATVQHAGPYSDLEIPSSMDSPSQEFIEKWVSPFYMWELQRPDKFINLYSPIRREVDRNLISSLLTWFNWRSRIVGAYLAAIEDMNEFTEHLGRLLLRSDVTYSGEGYALALAMFNSDLSRDFLAKYLDYYLTRNDLWFDQGNVLAAVAHLDELNGTNTLEWYIPQWRTFIADKPHHDLDKYREKFDLQIRSIRRIAKFTRD